MIRSGSYENLSKGGRKYDVDSSSNDDSSLFYDSVHTGLLRESEYQQQEPPDAKNRESVLKTVAGYIIVTDFCEVSKVESSR
jgi:hypothetical protein